MPEGAIQPDIDHENEPEDTIGENTTLNIEEMPQVALASSRPIVIWTPPFIVIFALTLVSGLSAEGLLTEGWLSSFYTGQWVFQAHVILISLSWLAILVLARSSWIRIGSIFGCIWALFMTLNITIIALHANSTSSVLVHVNAATCIALLGSYICLSIDRTPLSRLDAWFFGLAPIIGSIAVALIYFMTPAHARSLNTLENAIATVALVLSLLVWWIRPTSWKTQPGPAFLFGSVPILLLLLAIPNTIGFVRFNTSNFFLPHVVLYPGPLTDEAHFLYAQVALLCLLLGTMRVLQHERRAYHR
jgi:hypothetical protein